MRNDYLFIGFLFFFLAIGLMIVYLQPDTREEQENSGVTVTGFVMDNGVPCPINLKVNLPERR